MRRRDSPRRPPHGPCLPTRLRSSCGCFFVVNDEQTHTLMQNADRSHVNGQPGVWRDGLWKGWAWRTAGGRILHRFRKMWRPARRVPGWRNGPGARAAQNRGRYRARWPQLRFERFHHFRVRCVHFWRRSAFDPRHVNEGVGEALLPLRHVLPAEHVRTIPTLSKVRGSGLLLNGQDAVVRRGSGTSIATSRRMAGTPATA